MAFPALEVPSIQEGSSLLRSYALNEIREEFDDILVFHYEGEPYRSSDDELDIRPEKTGKISKLANGLGELYDSSIPKKIKPLYLPVTVETVQDEGGSMITVIDLVGCKIDDAQDFVKAVSATIQKPRDQNLAAPAGTPTPSDVLSSQSLNQGLDQIGKTFITGISLRGAVKPDKFLTLFVSIPYLGIGSTVRSSGSRTLKQYRLREPLNDLVTFLEDQVLVHQIWFLVFDNKTIGVFRSVDDTNWKRAPLFEYQPRGGAFQALVHMISNSLTSSEDEVLKHFRERAIQLELNQPPEIIPGEELNQSAETTSGARLKLEAEFRDCIIQVLTMMNVIALQTKYLERLRQIFLNSYPELDHRPQWNEFDIPLMSGHPEQMRSVMKSITAIVAEREKFYKELKNLAKEFETLRTLFLQRNQAESQTIVQDSLEKQGQTITVFTFVTSVFMPLGFMTSYYGMNPTGYESSITTPEQFWVYAGPITA
ncbi:hypothetical protein Q9L58_010424, partial [Maublancomyces gigas]